MDLEQLRCAGCGYSLRTLKRDGRCPECGMQVQDSLRSKSERALRRREDRIFSRMARYRRNRDAAGALAMLGLLGVIGHLLAPSAEPATGEWKYSLSLFAGITIVLIGGALYFGFQARYEHARSIEHCRKYHG